MANLVQQYVTKFAYIDDLSILDIEVKIINFMKAIPKNSLKTSDKVIKFLLTLNWDLAMGGSKTFSSI